MADPALDFTAADFLALAQALLPPGQAWPRDESALITKLLSGISGETSDFHNQAVNFLEFEANPYTTTVLLPDWEAAFGLPDPCVPQPQTLQQRRNALVGRLAADGGQSIAYYIAVAAAVGFLVTITEYRPYTCETPVDQPIYDDAWRFALGIHAPAETVVPFTCQSGCDDPLQVWGNELLECTIKRIAAAHITPLFFYGN